MPDPTLPVSPSDLGCVVVGDDSLDVVNAASPVLQAAARSKRPALPAAAEEMTPHADQPKAGAAGGKGRAGSVAHEERVDALKNPPIPPRHRTAASETPAPLAIESLLHVREAEALSNAALEKENRANAWRAYCALLLNPASDPDAVELSQLMDELQLTDSQVRDDAAMIRRLFELRDRAATEAQARQRIREWQEKRAAAEKAFDGADLEVRKATSAAHLANESRGYMETLARTRPSLFHTGTTRLVAETITG